jgi:hypothetical protein
VGMFSMAVPTVTKNTKPALVTYDPKHLEKGVGSPTRTLTVVIE